VKAVLAAGAALTLGACASVHVRTDHDPAVDFSRLTSYAWMTRTGGDHDALDDEPLVRKRAVAAVEDELAAAGIRRDDASPSFLVSVHAATRDRLHVVHWPSSPWPAWGYGWRRSWAFGAGFGWGYDTDVMQYTEGALTVDFVSPSTSELLWRGVATSLVDDEWGSEERVEKAVHELFERYPPSGD
jgi:hypothetical protein